MIRIPGVCSWDDSTVVLCHTNGAGMALKEDDSEAAFGCFSCHCAVDGKPTVKHEFSKTEIDLMFSQAVKRTRDFWRKNNLIMSYK